MLKPRLLILKSINDEISLRETTYLARSHHLEDFELRICYAIQMTEYKENSTYAIPYTKLLDNLEMEVQSFQPNILLLHTGIAFRTKPESFLQALAVIKSRHPEIELRYEYMGNNKANYSRSNVIPIERLLEDNELFSSDERELLP